MINLFISRVPRKFLAALANEFIFFSRFFANKLRLVASDRKDDKMKRFKPMWFDAYIQCETNSRHSIRAISEGQGQKLSKMRRLMHVATSEWNVSKFQPPYGSASKVRGPSRSSDIKPPETRSARQMIFSPRVSARERERDEMNGR